MLRSILHGWRRLILQVISLPSGPEHSFRLRHYRALAFLRGITFGLFFLSVVCTLKTQDYEIKGKVQLTFFVGEQADHKPTIYFTFSRNRTNWLLRTTREDQPTKYYEAAYDGKQLYYLSKLSGELQRTAADNIAVGWIFKNTEILHNVFMLEAGPLWLAFASDNHFRELLAHEGKLEPVITIGAGPGQYSPGTHFKQKAKWALTKSPPHLPQRVIYFDEGLIRLPQKVKPSRRPPPYDQGFTNAIFLVHCFTNINSISIPLTATLDVYRPDPVGKQATDLRRFYSFGIYTSQVSLQPNVVEFKPKLPGKTAFSDTRFEDRIGSFGYKADNWLSENEVQNLPQFKIRAASIRNYSFRQKKANDWRRIILPLIIMLFFAPIPVLLYARHSKQNKEGTKQ